jgi:hypothetical protein
MRSRADISGLACRGEAGLPAAGQPRRRARSGKGRVLLALLGAALALALLAAPADADISFCPPGSGAGQCSGARGIALDQETGRLYVADNNNNRINVFAEDGDFLLAFGWGVADGATAALQSCGPAATPPTAACFKGIAGTGPGQLSGATKVAVDNSGAAPHAVYVADELKELNFRVQKFTPTGEFVWTIGEGVDDTDGGDLCTKAEAHACGAGAESSAPGGFKFSLSVSVGPGGIVHVLDNVREAELIFEHRLQRFDPNGTAIDQCTLATGLGRAKALDVDSLGDLWVVNELTGRGVRKYDSGCALDLLLPETADRTNGDVALDESGNPFVNQQQERAIGSTVFAITAYQPDGEILSRFGYGRTGGGDLAARNGGEGGIFTSAVSTGLQRLDYPPPPPTLPSPGPIPVLPSLETLFLGSVKATAFAEVNPEGKATEAHFEYLSEADWQAQGESFTGPATKTTPTVALSEEGFELEATEALLGCPNPATEAPEPESKCLLPETTYRWRVVATNADNPSGSGEASLEGAPFTTKQSIELGETYATAVSTDTARLHIEANPLGVPATGFFEYTTEAAYQADVGEGGDGFAGATKAPNVDAGQEPLDFGASEAMQARSTLVHPLQPATAYRYRIVLDNPLVDPIEGEASLFRTFPAPQGESCPQNEASRIGPGALLPDCRAYEMVSPIDKDGGDIRVVNSTDEVPVKLEQASLSGEKLTYSSNRAFGDAISGPASSQYIAQRLDGQEWQTHAINSPRGAALYGPVEQYRPEFFAFSADLCEAWLAPFAELPAPDTIAGVQNLYRRSDRLCGEEGYEALAPVITPAESSELHLEALSADGSRAAFTYHAALDPQASDARQLYITMGGAAPRFVCLLPDGSGASTACHAGSTSLGGNVGAMPGKIAADGSRLFWSSGETGRIYLRQNPAAPESARLHGAATGKGTLIGPAIGTGNVAFNSEFITNVKPDPGSAFAVGQQITDSNGGIPAATTITAIEETSPGVFKLTLSAKYTKAGKIGVGLTGLASQTVPALLTETGAFEAGQEISAAAIPPGATVTACSPSCGPAATSLTLSAKATETETEAPLSATSPCTEAATKACTIAVSQAAEGETGTEKSSTFWGAAQDGSRAIFSTSVSGAADNLYSFDVESGTTTKIAEGVVGGPGTDEEARRVYFVSGKVLDAGASAGALNLYFYDGGVGGGPSFIGALQSQAEVSAISVTTRYKEQAFQLSRDGLHLAFVSRAPLTGYDNKPEGEAGCGGPGVRCEQVYLYDAAAEELRCASCNPSGGRPAGNSSVPSLQDHPLSDPRLLAEDGARLYFESADALIPRDTNGQKDVYQWEAPGTGSCSESSPTYSLLNQGCVDLISSGQSQLDSRFVEATASGEDVFIATASSLLPQDPGGVDIYDARVDGGLPIPQGLPPACEGEACQGVVEAPNDPTPSSSTFEGAGNVVEGTKPRPRCAKGKVRRRGRCVPRKQRKTAKRGHRKRRAVR